MVNTHFLFVILGPPPASIFLHQKLGLAPASIITTSVSVSIRLALVPATEQTNQFGISEESDYDENVIKEQGNLTHRKKNKQHSLYVLYKKNELFNILFWIMNINKKIFFCIISSFCVYF